MQLNWTLLHRTLRKCVQPCAIGHTKKVGGVTNFRSKLKGIWGYKSPSCNHVHLMRWFEATSQSSLYQQQTLERDGRHLASLQAPFCTSNAGAVAHGPAALSFLTRTHTHACTHTHTRFDIITAPKRKWHVEWHYRCLWSAGREFTNFWQVAATFPPNHSSHSLLNHEGITCSVQTSKSHLSASQWSSLT